MHDVNAKLGSRTWRLALTVARMQMLKGKDPQCAPLLAGRSHFWASSSCVRALNNGRGPPGSAARCSGRKTMGLSVTHKRVPIRGCIPKSRAATAIKLCEPACARTESCGSIWLLQRITSSSPIFGKRVCGPTGARVGMGSITSGCCEFCLVKHSV